MIADRRYTSGQIALANLLAQIDSFERCRIDDPSFDQLVTLSDLLFVRGNVLGVAADHHRAELIGGEAIALAPEAATALYLRARLAERCHRFQEASALLGQARIQGYPAHQVCLEEAVLLQATGRYPEALALRQRLARDEPGIHTLGSLAALLGEMDDWQAAEAGYAAAVEADQGVSPFPCAELLFEWSVQATRRGDLQRAAEVLTELERILPQHAGARAQRVNLRASAHAVAR
jgi:tetratricopeptide (TPR) repeat protein